MLFKKILPIIGLFLFFALIIMLRFWKVPETFFFGIDEEYSSLLALSIIKDFHIIWIGLSAANTGFYIGPGLVYVHAFLLWLSKLNPIILAYTASFIGVINAIFFYWVIKKLFNNKIAIISTFIYSLSSFVILYDRRFWNSSFVPLTAILFYYSLVQLKKDFRWLIVVAGLIGFSFHIHASLFIFIPISFAVIIKTLKQITSGNFFAPPRNLSKIKKANNQPANQTHNTSKVQLFITLVGSLIIFIFIYSPLLVFDFVHNFDNLKTPLRMFLNWQASRGENLILSHITVFKQTVLNFFMAPDQSNNMYYLLFFIALGIIIFFIFSKKNWQKHFVLATIISFYLLLFLLYPGKMLDYYYIGFFPFFSVIVAIFLSRLKNIIIFSIIVIYAFLSLNTIVKQPLNSGIKFKEELIRKTLSFIKDDSYYLATNQNYLYFGGWRYLFEAYGKSPAKSDADLMFGWIYQKEISPEVPKYKIYVTNGFFDPQQPTLFHTSSGIYHAYVVKFLENIDK